MPCDERFHPENILKNVTYSLVYTIMAIYRKLYPNIVMIMSQLVAEVQSEWNVIGASKLNTSSAQQASNSKNAHVDCGKLE